MLCPSGRDGTFFIKYEANGMYTYLNRCKLCYSYSLILKSQCKSSRYDTMVPWEVSFAAEKLFHSTFEMSNFHHAGAAAVALESGYYYLPSVQPSFCKTFPYVLG